MVKSLFEENTTYYNLYNNVEIQESEFSSYLGISAFLYAFGVGCTEIMKFQKIQIIIVN